MKKFLAAIITIGGLGAAAAVPVVPDREYYVREKPVAEDNFVARDDADISKLKKAHIIGKACYNEFHAFNKKPIRERIACKEYWRIVNTPYYPQPKKEGYTWHAYETLLFDTASGDLEEGYYAEGDEKPKKTILQGLIKEAKAAIAYDTTTNSGDDSGVSSHSWSHTAAAGSNLVIIVGCSLNDSNTAERTVSTVTYNSNSLTNIRRDDNDTDDDYSDAWQLVSPDTGSLTVAVTYGGTVTSSTCGSFTFSGVDQSNPIDAHNGEGASNEATNSVDITTVADNAWIVEIATMEAPGSTYSCSPASGQTERYDNQVGASAIYGCAYTEGPITPAGTQTQSIDCVGSFCSFAPPEWAHTVISLKPKSGASSQDPVKIF